MSNTTPQHSSNSAATDVPQLIGELDAGQFERMVSIALSQCAASTVDNGKKSKVKIELDIEPIKGTHQVRLHHKLIFSRPTTTGKSSEEATTSTPLHVGKYGRLSLVPENQVDMFKAKSETA